MEIAYTVPAEGEIYAIRKKEAARVVRSLCPDLPLLAFQTMHVPKMDFDIPYLATWSSGYIRILSVGEGFMRDDLRTQFSFEVLPYICNAVTERRRTSYSWPSVMVVFLGMIREIGCSEGWLFPSREEIIRRATKQSGGFCSDLITSNSGQDADGTPR